MTTSFTPEQKLLVGVSYFQAIIILSALGATSHSQIKDTDSAFTDDYTGLDAAHLEPGLYVWTGRIMFDDGEGQGEYGSKGDPDYEFQGTFRKATLEDLPPFGFKLDAEADVLLTKVVASYSDRHFKQGMLSVSCAGDGFGGECSPKCEGHRAIDAAVRHVGGLPLQEEGQPTS